ncbi:hypothetical protein ACHAW5_002971 [Stephanodiscus triporus]|uniref:Uncharacterized protein n=1 Tax=Stephanodiscus triporus TaxID=2934178 RepID=A0ABD3PF75_9STRA
MASGKGGSRHQVADESKTSEASLLASVSPAPSVAVVGASTEGPLLPDFAMAPNITGGASISAAPLLLAVAMAPNITGGASTSSAVPLLQTVAMAPNIAVGTSISVAPALPAVTSSPEVAGASTTTAVLTIAAPPPKNAVSAFLEKNSSIRSLIVLSIGIKDDNGAALIDLDADPRTSLPSSMRPQWEDLAEEILRQYVSENLSDRPEMKREPKPKQWDKRKCSNG